MSFLTREALERTFEAIRNQPPHPCRLGQHLITAKAKRQGYGICIECGQHVGKWPS